MNITINEIKDEQIVICKKSEYDYLKKCTMALENILKSAKAVKYEHGEEYYCYYRAEETIEQFFPGYGNKLIEMARQKIVEKENEHV